MMTTAVIVTAAALFLVGAAAAPGGNLFFSTSTYNISVTGNGNVPKYTFTSTNTDSAENFNVTYKIMYSKIFETDAVGKKLKTISLPSLNWDIERDATDGNVFWINCTGANGGQTVPWTDLAFKNTYSNDTVKFDVILDGYQWFDTAATAFLNFAWKFSNEDEPEENEGGLVPDAGAGAATQKCFGNGLLCFDIVSTANVTNSSGITPTDVELSFDGADGITVSYTRFYGNLYHDPEFGFATTKSTACDGGFSIACFISTIFQAIFFCF
jgi:hypothetical protein